MQAASSRCRADKLGIALPFKFFPSIGTAQVGSGWSFCDEHDLGGEFWEILRLRDGTPQVVFNDKEARLGMRQELEVLGCGQFVIQRDEHATAEEDRISRNQPFRLIRHDNGGPVAGPEGSVF